jgi:hypothetical protein
MQFYLLLWLSQHPSLVNTDEGTHQLVLAALAFTQDASRDLPSYERSLLNRVARRHMTLGHLLAYLQEHEQA